MTHIATDVNSHDLCHFYYSKYQSGCLDAFFGVNEMPKNKMQQNNIFSCCSEDSRVILSVLIEMVGSGQRPDNEPLIKTNS